MEKKIRISKDGKSFNLSLFFYINFLVEHSIIKSLVGRVMLFQPK